MDTTDIVTVLRDLQSLPQLLNNLSSINNEESTKSFSISPSNCKPNAVSADVFDDIYTKHTWYGVSRSGQGSDLQNVMPTLDHLNKFIIDHNVSSFADVPCGVESWQFASQQLNTMNVYFGGDISKNVIDENKKKFQHHEDKVFETWDLTKCKIPKYQMMDDDDNMYRDFDMAMTRDVIMHLPLNEGLKFVKNVVMSDIKYWAVTSYPVDANTDIQTGQFYQNNMEIEPFNLPKENILMKEKSHPAIEIDDFIVYKIDENMREIVQAYNIAE